MPLGKLSEFLGGFGDFETLAHDVDLQNYVVRCWVPSGNGVESKLKMIVGWTKLDNDYLLHCTTAPTPEFPLDDLVEWCEKHGIEFIPLKALIGSDGFAILPQDQGGLTDAPTIKYGYIANDKKE